MKNKIKKIAFPYIEKSYVIYHSIGIAIELAKELENEVHILCTDRNYPIVCQLLEEFNCTTIIVQKLRPHWYFNVPHYIELTGQVLRKSLFWKYRKMLAAYDLFVCTIYLDLWLKKILSSDNKAKYIYTKHGIPNRAYSFDGKVLDFDLFFILGNKEHEMRTKLNQLTSINHAITGFLKYDALAQSQQDIIFKNKNKTIIYNPHWEQRFSSFHKFGFQVLDFFVKNKNYNLIFAPHSILFERNWNFYFSLKKYRNYENIHIDLGSEAANNMSYTRYADIYLGDISGQAMEFIYIKKRPCLFLDAHDLANNPKDRPLSWDLGLVINNIEGLETKINKALESHQSKYLTLQEERIETMFFRNTLESASSIAAKSIQQLLMESDS